MSKQEGLFNRAFKKIQTEVNETVDDFKLKKRLKDEFSKNSVKMIVNTNLISNINYNKKLLAKNYKQDKKIILYGFVEIKKDDVLTDDNEIKYLVKQVSHNNDYLFIIDGKKQTAETTEVLYELV